MSDPASRPTRRLLLLRHAKSDWDESGLADHERPLSRRGRRAAAKIGTYMAGTGYTPGLVLCSSSRRTQETFERLRPRLLEDPVLEVLDDLYLASPDTLLSCIAAAPSDQRELMVIAHNPGIAALAGTLAETGDTVLRGRLRKRYPTGALAVFASGSDGWHLPEAELIDFVCPRDLGSG